MSIKEANRNKDEDMRKCQRTLMAFAYITNLKCQHK